MSSDQSGDPRNIDKITTSLHKELGKVPHRGEIEFYGEDFREIASGSVFQEGSFIGYDSEEIYTS